MDKSHCACEKKDGTHRFCVDYQQLNSMTRADTFLLPQIDDYWTSSGSQCISQPSTLLLGIGRSACTSIHSKRPPLWHQRGCMSLSDSFWTHCHLLATHGMYSDGAQPWRRTRFHYSIYWLVFSNTLEEQIDHLFLCLAFEHLVEAGLKLSQLHAISSEGKWNIWGTTPLHRASTPTQDLWQQSKIFLSLRACTKYVRSLEWACITKGSFHSSPKWPKHSKYWPRKELGLILCKTQQGNKHIVVFQDFFTKWPMAYSVPFPDQKHYQLHDCLLKRTSHSLVVPEAILLDWGTNLLSHLVLDIRKFLGINKLNTTSDLPQCDCMVEWFNWTLKTMLRKHSVKYCTLLDNYLPGVLWASCVLFGMDCRSPTEDALLPPTPIQVTDVSDYKEAVSIATLWSTGFSYQVLLAGSEEAQKVL